MNYNKSETTAFLLSLETQGIKLGLSRTKKLLSICGNPEKRLKSVQIIGTNGKGSTAASLSSILQSQGLKVGIYTSPHLVKFNERIQINNTHIPDRYINQFIQEYQNQILELSCTFFETLTVLALHYFDHMGVDIAVLETGLGGRYDSVSACMPQLHLFTHISKDHMHLLGNSIEEIALNKAHAIRSGVPCISVQQEIRVKKVLNQYAKDQSTFIDYNIYDSKFSSYVSPINGEHQKDNLLLAIHAAKSLFDIDLNTITKGIKNIVWPGRIQVLQLNPIVIFDVSHNVESILSLCDYLASKDYKGKKTLLISIQKTKQINSTSSKLYSLFDHIICTQLNERMYEVDQLASIFELQEKIEKTSDPSSVIKSFINKSQKDDLLVIMGSHYWGDLINNYFKNFFDRN